MMSMPGRSYSGALSPLEPEQSLVGENLQRHVAKLAGEIGERHVWRVAALNASASYLEDTLTAAGYRVTSQNYQAEGMQVGNLVAELRGTSRPDEIIIVGGHYDTVTGTPGANDNASGCAAVLELARLMAGQKLSRTVRFVLFVNEEPPFFQTDLMGSRVYARQCRQRGEKVVAMLSVETIGCYFDSKGSQHYPWPFSLFYPDTGNFIAFVGDSASRSLVRQCTGLFRQHAAFPSEGAALPGGITGIGWSDHWSFWQEGYPALMVTDTAPFRYAHYHERQDTPDKLDYGRMARVVSGLVSVVKGLASEEHQ